jgi:uncharacterized protein
MSKKTNIVSNNGKTALITGASSGIGEGFTKVFAENGYNLVIVARSKDKLELIKSSLEAKHKIKVEVIVQDLSLDDAAKKIYSEVEKRGITINVLVNDAGFGTHGFFYETDFDKEIDMIHVHCVALTGLTKLFLKDMVKRNEGKILNVASTAAFQPGPLMAVYFATKAYILSLSEALANEVNNKNIVITALCPGPVDTPFQEKAHTRNIPLVTNWKLSTADEVARFGYASLMKGKTTAICGTRNFLIAELVRFLPRKTAASISRSLQGSGYEK